jgi:prepilin-type N-terminal cleavage/methylation domain-containing protein
MKKGFTLAEVLITLAIIGVVAALTIPNVVKNYQKNKP